MTSCVSFLPSTSNPETIKNTRQRCFCFSEDGRFFAVGTTDGFVIYCTEPFVPLTVREVNSHLPPGSSGVSLIAMFARSNLLLLVSPADPKKVLLWNEAHSPPSICGEASFHSDIMAIRLHQALIVVADSNGVHVFNPKMVCSHSFQYNDASRSLGLPSLAIPGSAVCSLSSLQHHQMLSMAAANQNGSTASSLNSLPNLLMQHHNHDDNDEQQHQPQFSQLQQHNIFPIALACPMTRGNILFVQLDIRNPASFKVIHRRSVPVHNKAVAIVTFCQNAKFVASCSTGGTALKLVHVQTGSVLMQFNRGTTPNQIHSLAFAGLSYLACVSGTGSVHLFAIVDKVQRMLAKIGDKNSFDKDEIELSEDDEEDNDRKNDDEPKTAKPAAATNGDDENDDDFVDVQAPSAAYASLASRQTHNHRSTANKKAGGVFGFFQTLMQSTTNFQEGVWSCGHFDLLQLHPSATKRALFGPAICAFLSEGMVDEDGSLKFLVAHGESGKIGKVSFLPNDSTAEKNLIQQSGAASYQSQNAAALQVPMGSCKIVTAWSFPTDAF